MKMTKMILAAYAAIGLLAGAAPPKPDTAPPTAPAVAAAAHKTTPQLSEAEKIGAHLQNVSVTIKKSNRDRGSGTIITRLVDGRKVNFVLTAHHVIADLRQTKVIVTPDGDKKTTVSYKLAEILQEWIDDETGERVGETKVFAEVISVDAAKDIALLRVKAKGWRDCSIEFYLGDRIPSGGAPCIHTGSPGGQEIGAASVLRGNIARVGCRMEEFSREPFDQINCAGLPGSSGGMVTDEQGKWIGMVTLGLRGGSDNFHWMVPVRIVKKWAQEAGVEWLLDPKGKTSKEALKKIPLENVRPGYDAGAGGGTAHQAATRVERMDVRHKRATTK